MPSFNGIPDLAPGSWLARAFEYARVRSKLPDVAVFWTLTAMCGAILRDLVCVRWATKVIFPNLPLLVVGPSGIGKTGAVNVILPLFKGLLPYKIAEDSTAESLVRDLAYEPLARGFYGNACAYWCIPELADTFGGKDYQRGLVARLTRLLDNPFNRAESRKGQNRDLVIPGHCILSWLAGTTLDWLREHVDEAAGTGGFLPRLFICNVVEAPKFVPNPIADVGVEEALNAELQAQFPRVVAPQEQVDLGGPDWEAVYRRTYEDSLAALNVEQGPFIQRRAENVVRIFLVLNKFAQVRTSSHALFWAEKCAKWLEDQALTVHRDLKSSLFRTVLDKTLSLVRRHECGISYTQLCRNAHMPSRALFSILCDLLDRNEITWDRQKGTNSIIRATVDSSQPE